MEPVESIVSAAFWYGAAAGFVAGILSLAILLLLTPPRQKYAPHRYFTPEVDPNDREGFLGA